MKEEKERFHKQEWVDICLTSKDVLEITERYHLSPRNRFDCWNRLPKMWLFYETKIYYGGCFT